MPVSNSSPIDYRCQILENARFWSRPGADLHIVTSREPLDKWRVLLLRGEEVQSGQRRKKARQCRELLMSEAAATELEAFRLLHVKSGEAVYNHISTLGYDYLKDVRKHSSKKLDDESDSDDDTRSIASSTSTVSSLSDVISNASSSDEDDKFSVTSLEDNSSKAKNRKCRSKSSKASNESRRRNRSRSRSPIRRPDAVGHPRPLPGRTFPPPSFARAGMGPPPPPPSYSGPPQTAPVAQPTRFPAPPGAPGPLRPSGPASSRPPPPPPDMPAASPMMPLKVIRMHITWLGHGDIKVFDSSAPLRRSITEAALAYVRGHTASFPNVSPLDNSPARLWGMKAVLRQGVFGSETYDLSSYPSDDLTRLFDFAGEKDIPLFELEVMASRPTGPGGMPPRMSLPAA